MEKWRISMGTSSINVGLSSHLPWVISHVPIFHITQPWSVLMVFLMATIFGDVQYSPNGTFTNPCLQGNHSFFCWLFMASKTLYITIWCLFECVLCHQFGGSNIGTASRQRRVVVFNAWTLRGKRGGLRWIRSYRSHGSWEYPYRLGVFTVDEDTSKYDKDIDCIWLGSVELYPMTKHVRQTCSGSGFRWAHIFQSLEWFPHETDLQGAPVPTVDSQTAG